MVEYEWGSPSHVLLPSAGEEEEDSNTNTLHPNYSFPATHPFSFYGFNHPFPSDIDVNSRAFSDASYPPPPPPMMTSSLDPAGFLMFPKPEPFYSEAHTQTNNINYQPGGIGLNLGLGTGRTYFPAADDDFVSRLYGRSSGGAGAVNPPRCQAEGCNTDLTHAKHYHRRHKVCEFHSKASTVVAAGLTQRFCQQCSRFHLLTEFDNGKRSCRRRLADHNRRRRKCNKQDRGPSQNSDNPSRSPSDSDAVMVAGSPARMSVDSSSATSSSVSTPQQSSTSIFY